MTHPAASAPTHRYSVPKAPGRTPPLPVRIALWAALIAAVAGGWWWWQGGYHEPTPGGAVATGKYFERDGRWVLYGGEDPSEHFDAEPLRIDPDQLQYGYGREHFPALVEPAFVSADDADAWLPDHRRVLVAQVGEDVAVYPVGLLTRHEVVNDVVGGVPVMAAYCSLADLGAVYDRRLDGGVLTFGVSGYVYAEEGIWDGRAAFVLWDRQTQSLWWPPVGKAVSGPLVDEPMRLLEPSRWAQTTWGAVKAEHPADRLRVLAPGQGHQAPPPGAAANLKRSPGDAPPAVAPKWGENPSLGQ